MLFSILALLLPLTPSSFAAEDPFLWLEEVDSAPSLQWVEQKNAGTMGRLQGRAIYPRLEKEMGEIVTSTSRLPSISLANGNVYTFWQDQAHPRGLWQRMNLAKYKAGSGEWEVILNLDELNKIENKNWVWKGANCLAPENELCLISLSPGGGDAVEIREFHVSQKTFVTGGFVVPVAKSDVSWVNKDAILVGTDFGPGSLSKSGYPIVNKRWQRGTALKDAVEIFRGEPEDMVAVSETTIQPGWQPEYRRRVLSFYEAEVNLVLADGKLARIPLPTDADLRATIGSKAFFLLTSDLKLKSGKIFKSGTLVGYPLLEIGKGEESLDLLETVFAPTDKRFLNNVVRSGNYLLLNVMDNVKGKLLRAQRVGPGWKSVEIPLGESGLAEAQQGDAYSPQFLATYMDFLTPTTQFTGNAGTAKAEKLRSSPQFFDNTGLVTEQLEATSKDGTKVPYFITHRKDYPLDGTNPTLLYGYGGFQISLTPWYSATVGKAWLEKGGVFVVANIRGGGEFGPEWHEAARLKNKQRSYDDFIAVAEDLIARQITSPAHLGIEGGSNGGLLMGAAFTQRPDLFSAVLCEVPLLDMMRYHLLLAGASWMDEYGNPEDAEMREVILKYSPYQNAKAGVKYPEVFFTTSTRDDRVHPGHARKMAALLESLGQNVYYFENTEGGHGGSSTPEQKIRLLALTYSYLWGQLQK